jgi:hypothetical protein
LPKLEKGSSTVALETSYPFSVEKKQQKSGIHQYKQRDIQFLKVIQAAWQRDERIWKSFELRQRPIHAIWIVELIFELQICVRAVHSRLKVFV